MNAFFYGLEDLFVNFLFAPFDFLRFLENWWAANLINWILFFIGAAAMIYWMLELKKYDDNNEEDKSISAHSYL